MSSACSEEDSWTNPFTSDARLASGKTDWVCFLADLECPSILTEPEQLEGEVLHAQNKYKAPKVIHPEI